MSYEDSLFDMSIPQESDEYADDMPALQENSVLDYGHAEPTTLTKATQTEQTDDRYKKKAKKPLKEIKSSAFLMPKSVTRSTRASEVDMSEYKKRTELSITKATFATMCREMVVVHVNKNGYRFGKEAL